MLNQINTHPFIQEITFSDALGFYLALHSRITPGGVQETVRDLIWVENVLDKCSALCIISLTQKNENLYGFYMFKN